jgi:hypothetical protein
MIYKIRVFLLPSSFNLFICQIFLFFWLIFILIEVIFKSFFYDLTLLKFFFVPYLIHILLIVIIFILINFLIDFFFQFHTSQWY